MERRRHPRIRLPLLVELQHPSLGKTRCVTRDVSEGGVFVLLENPTIRPPAKLRVTLLNSSAVDNHPTPTVEMIVSRVEVNGLALEFINKTSRHLWESVERLRDELEVGRDYFQVHQSAVVVNEAEHILLVQQHGKWMFPGEYLIVGEDWQAAIKGFLVSSFSLKDVVADEILAMDSTGENILPEAAVLNVFHLIRANSESFTMTERYKSFRWVNSRRSLAEITFASDTLRQLAGDVLRRTIAEDLE
ncbi:MAG: PilZ domain-containing protein [Gammaproteobacteria bacterium]|nr:PilZ domain-containing protein [Gammaproteobacteria bacterium]